MYIIYIYITCKIKRGGGGAGPGLSKSVSGGEGWWGGSTFSISFLQGLSFLHLEITLSFAKLCYAFEEKLFFLILGKKTIRYKLSKNGPENIP